jgi:hypothetical protein
VKMKIFTKTNEFSTFDAEYLREPDGSIVFHFFLPDDLFSGQVQKRKIYWSAVFPELLSNLAQEYFQATYPRLRAAFTEEVNSWWMQAGGFGHILELEVYVNAFFAQLDAKIDAHYQRTSL